MWSGREIYKPVQWVIIYTHGGYNLFCLLYISVPYFHILSVIYFSSVFSYFACYIFQFRIFTSPFQHVGFADFWLADQLNSLVIVLLDFEFMACFYAFEVDWLGPDREYSNRFLLSLFSAKNKSMNFKEFVKVVPNFDQYFFISTCSMFWFVVHVALRFMKHWSIYIWVYGWMFECMDEYYFVDFWFLIWLETKSDKSWIIPLETSCTYIHIYL